MKKKDEPHQKYDRAFQAIFEEFRTDTGITSKRNYQTDEKWQYKRPDTIIILEENFDYHILKDKTFPCLKEWNAIEFKSFQEKLNLTDIPKYIANTNLLAAQMLKDRKEKGLNAINKYVSLIMVSSEKPEEEIMTDFEPCEFRKGFHILKNHPYFPVYLAVIDGLDIIRCNYPLLLLGNEKKQEELWRQLIKDIKKELNAKEVKELWKYMIFSIKRNIFNLKEGEVMEEIKELSEVNESINRLFDDEFLGKILRKKDDEFLGKILKEKDDEFLGKILKEKDDEFLEKVLRKKNKNILTSFLLKFIKEDGELKKAIQEELQNE